MGVETTWKEPAWIVESRLPFDGYKGKCLVCGFVLDGVDVNDVRNQWNNHHCTDDKAPTVQLLDAGVSESGSGEG